MSFLPSLFYHVGFCFRWIVGSSVFISVGSSVFISVGSSVFISVESFHQRNNARFVSIFATILNLCQAYLDSNLLARVKKLIKMLSQAMSPTFMANFARLVAQQLQQGGVANSFSSRPDFLPENRAISAYNNRTPPVPNSNSHQVLAIEDAPKISRSLSSSSTSSTSQQSFEVDEQVSVVPRPLRCSYDDDMDVSLDIGIDFENYSGKKKKAKFLPQDKTVVNDAILKVLDPLYLAPLNSDLFKRMRVKMPDANGFRRLKKNPDIVIELFKTLTKPTLRRLLRLARGGDTSNLRQRYFYAALAVTTKRRANHIQSWRLNGGPLSFCYGGQEIYEGKYGPVVYNSMVKAKKKIKSEKTQAKKIKSEKTQASQDPFALKADFSDEDESQVGQLQNVVLDCVVCGDKVTFMLTAEQKPQKNFMCVICLKGGKAKCTGCGKYFEKKLMFPKSDSEFNMQQNTLKCNFCWQTLIKNKILPEANKKSEQLAKNTGKGTAGKSIKKCKCGSTTHKTANSRLCPLNKRYNTAEGIFFISYLISHISYIFDY